LKDRSKAELFRALGYQDQHEALDARLVDAGLTTPGKERISAAKRARVAEALGEAFVRVCRRGDCQAFAPGRWPNRTVVAATAPSKCEVCGGSAAAVAREAALRACGRAGWRRLCVVGGSPKARTAIEREHRPPPELRLIDGTVARTRSIAKDDLAWADHVVVWGGTQLDHKVSKLYTSAPTCTTVVRRSVQALWEHIATAADRAGD